MRRGVAVVLTIGICSCASPPASSPTGGAGAAGAGKTRGPVVVTIVVDQFAAWVAAERLPLLPNDGGFARLRREGTWVVEARHGHACTDTAPGHAALYTGVGPRENHVFANEVPDEHGDRISVLQDVRTRAVAADGRTLDGPSSSIARVPDDVSTVADRLRAAKPGAFIASISLKDRGAIFGGGRRPDASLWLDTSADTFVTSTAFARDGRFPAWAAPLAGHTATAALRAVPWSSPLDVAWVSAHASTPDAQRGEGHFEGLGRTFPHDFTKTENPPSTMRASPAADGVLLGLALAAVDAGGRAGAPVTLVAVSLSTNDYVGHVWGSDSWEAWDELFRLDAALGRFFSALDARVGRDGWSVVLAADHGVGRMPEVAARPEACGPNDRWQRPCGTGTRILPDALAAELRAEAGDRTLVRAVADPWIFVAPGARPRLDDVVRAVAKRHPEIRAVYTREELAVTTDPLLRETAPPVAGDYYVLTQPGSFFDALYVPGEGVSHGTPWLYDRAVPVLARGRRIAAGVVRDDPLPFTVFTHTALGLLGVEPPDGAGPTLLKP